jgi:hypothetical protein
MEIYEYRIEVVTVGRPDLTGFAVDAKDGHIGKVDEATFKDRSGCLVVDTGFWIFGKKRMIPGGVVDGIDWDERKITLAMTKDQVKQAPDYDAERHAEDEEAHHAEQADYYNPFAAG